jgi:hypothetical protein
MPAIYPREITHTDFFVYGPLTRSTHQVTPLNIGINRILVPTLNLIAPIMLSRCFLQ